MTNSPTILDEALTHLSALIAFDTTSHKSNLDLIAYVETALQPLGARLRRYPDATGTKANLVAEIGPEGPGGIILSGHVDTVPVDGQDWSSDPFTLTDIDGRLHGRGTCDMKGFVACCLALFSRLTSAQLTAPVILCLSHDEEIGCVGVRSVIADLPRWPAPSACIVGEPTGMQVVVGHKTKRSVRMTVRGRGGHSSLAPMAVNAVEYAAAMIVAIRAIGARLQHSGPFDPAYDVPFTTAHVGVIRGGTQLNIVPDLCTVDFEFRVLPESDADALVDEVRDAANAILPAMRTIAPEADITFSEIASFPGLAIDPADPVVARALSAAGRNAVSKVPYGAEAGLFQAAGVPTVICGPGHIAQAHKADEFVDTAQLRACLAMLTRLTNTLRA